MTQEISCQKKTSIPPLVLIDDIISITNCSADSIKANAVVNMKIEKDKKDYGIDLSDE